MTDYISTYASNGAAVDAALARADTALQNTDLDTLAKLNALVTDATLLADDAPVLPTTDQKAALDGANAPDASNAFATMADISSAGGGDLSASDIDTLAKINSIISDATLIDGDTLATVATSGEYSDLSGTPTLATVATSGDYNDLINKPTGAGSGDMDAATYDPQNVGGDAFDRANHTGEQAISTVTGLQTALDDKLEETDIDELAKLNALITDTDLAGTDTDNTWTGEQTFTETKETTHTLSGTAIDPANGTMQSLTLSGDETLTEALEDGQSATLRVVDADSHTLTWPTMSWVGKAPADFGGDLTGNDVFVLWKEDGTLFGLYAGGVV